MNIYCKKKNTMDDTLLEFGKPVWIAVHTIAFGTIALLTCALLRKK